ncbi:MAG: hypothetical protein Pg6C_11140 [Treponemataceae bacterium]|nr:MAG: hypothetical protein Pg6C_11140 [Treponemataceae bacterium]
MQAWAFSGTNWHRYRAPVIIRRAAATGDNRLNLRH